MLNSSTALLTPKPILANLEEPKLEDPKTKDFRSNLLFDLDTKEPELLVVLLLTSVIALLMPEKAFETIPFTGFTEDFRLLFSFDGSMLAWAVKENEVCPSGRGRRMTSPCFK